MVGTCATVDELIGDDYDQFDTSVLGGSTA